MRMNSSESKTILYTLDPLAMEYSTSTVQSTSVRRCLAALSDPGHGLFFGRVKEKLGRGRRACFRGGTKFPFHPGSFIIRRLRRVQNPSLKFQFSISSKAVDTTLCNHANESMRNCRELDSVGLPVLPVSSVSSSSSFHSWVWGLFVLVSS